MRFSSTRFFFSLLFLAAALLRPAPAGERMVLGYYPSWIRGSYPHTAVQYQHLTHIAHAFIFPFADGTLEMSGFAHYPELIQTAHQQGVKVVISVGGWDLVRTPRFATMVADPTARTRFVSNLKNFCQTYGYDGADIDWEYPAPADRPNATLLFQELRAAFNTVMPPLSLSIAAPSGDWSGRYDWTVMKEVLDWIGIMTYDFYGSWTTKAGPNSALYGTVATTDQGWIDNSMIHYKAKGIPAEKLLFGIPFYGWQFNASTLFGPSTGASQLTYNNIAPLLQQGWTRHWDLPTRTPFLVNPLKTRVISYDDSASIAEKAAYLKNQSLGGVILWALGQDYMNGQQPLLASLGAALKSTTSIPIMVGETPPLAFELSQNYPNPFNAQTRIRYHITRGGAYTLRLYDPLGREIDTLAEFTHQPGSYEVTVSSATLPSGVYLYRLTGGGFTLARTMVVLR
ncbi:MAG: hypothetical protein A2059_00525 [Ignavibacteria bacterium GWA2_55_25]|nr:MAG: hypothetical protein A2059_00525 [Ignavibacteria bacterium GWA2_55_25]